jgi:hypothetical protein
MKQPEITQEMLKLREALSNRGIEWSDHSEKRSKERELSYVEMIRTRVTLEEGDILSVIWGAGSYGFEEGLLEAMILDSNQEPDGYMTAKQILDKYVD